MKFETLKNELINLIQFDGDWFDYSNQYSKISIYLLGDYPEKNFSKSELEEIKKLCRTLFHSDKYIYKED